MSVLLYFQLLREKGVTYFRELRGELGEFRDRDGVATEPDHVVYLVRESRHVGSRAVSLKAVSVSHALA